MKVIELLTKIANGEEVPKKIKVGNEIWTYENVDYKASDDRGFLFEIHTRINKEDMNEEIEIIEEDIRKLPNEVREPHNFEEVVYIAEDLVNKINEIIDKINEMEWWHINKVNLIGRITKDLELRHTKNNKVVCEFTIATNRIGGKEADFITCQVWDKQAQNLVEYQGKGSLIGVSGEIRTESYEFNGKTHYKTYVIVNQVEYLSPIEKVQEKPTEAPKNPFEEFGQQFEVGEQTEIDLEGELPF